MSVFISYCHEDGELASRLHRDLTRRGIKCWLDKEDLLPGQRWRETIESAIRQSSHFIALLSQHSVSKEGFVQRELRIALDYLTEKPPDRIFLIPARADSSTPAHPALRDLHWVDLFPDYPSAVERIVRALAGSSATAAGSESTSPMSSSTPETHELPPLTSDRPRRLYFQFPIQELYSEIRAATEYVRLLFTWVYSPKPLLAALTPALNRGVKIKILVLDPVSDFALIRSKEMGFQDPRHGARQAEETFEAFSCWLRQESSLSKHAEVRVYDGSPVIVMIDTGDRLVYSPLFPGALAVEGPFIEARREDKELYLRIERHFEHLWAQAEDLNISRGVGP